MYMSIQLMYMYIHCLYMVKPVVSTGFHGQHRDADAGLRDIPRPWYLLSINAGHAQWLADTIQDVSNVLSGMNPKVLYINYTYMNIHVIYIYTHIHNR